MPNDNNLSVVAEAGEGEILLGARMAVRFHVPVEMVRAQPDAGSAFTLACSSSGLADKEIYTELGLDQGYFSKIKAGTATLQADKIAAFCHLVDNRVYPEWIAHQLGCTLVMVKSELERRLEAMEYQLKEERLKNSVLMEAFHGKALVAA